MIRLQVHLEHEHSVTLRDGDHLPSYIQRYDFENTMFTEWMKMNIIDTEARELTYADFPSKFV